MRTLTKELQNNISPENALQILKDGNLRFMSNIKMNRNLLQQVNETTVSQHPFAVIISCMDSRTSAELIFDQGLGDIFSIRIAGNIINEAIIGSAEFGCKVVGSKIIAVIGHTSCGAIKGAIKKVDLGHLHFITSKIQRCIPEEMEFNEINAEEMERMVTINNIRQGIKDLRSQSSILEDMVYKNEIKIVGGLYDIASGKVEFFEK
ncbi:MAG: carbonic anhydrase [Bacteriovoracaceae bacterium]